MTHLTLRMSNHVLAIHFHQFFTNSICIGSSKFQQATSLKDLDLKPIETLNGQPSIDKELAVLEKIKRDRDFHKYVKLDLVKESWRADLTRLISRDYDYCCKNLMHA